MKRPGLISLIVTTYEWPQALLRVLECLERQRDDNFEVIVADDGSGPATAEAIRQFQQGSRMAIRHSWQPHEGFRAAESRNRAVLASRGDYLIFLDGDCLARAGFLAAHRELAEPGWFVAGNRALLSERFTRELLPSAEAVADWSARSLGGWLGARLRGDVNRLAPMLRLPARWQRKNKPREWRGAKTCNLAVWREDFLAVDGFDESYVGWGHEDADLAVRLIRSGIQRKEGRFAASVLHLWHAAAPRQGLSNNEQRLADVLAAERTRAVVGIGRERPVQSST
ncbi:glycosyltransferase family 2 protein [Nevskia soli]|uniref:glycosyltransferase family 2 protein n=1 Tax=Nevskia soli TaxID=418856 RepID=UPI0004A777BF|nr:glycosyltransferase family 2 protein [Nevskia soli]